MRQEILKTYSIQLISFGLGTSEKISKELKNILNHIYKCSAYEFALVNVLLHF